MALVLALGASLLGSGCESEPRVEPPTADEVLAADPRVRDLIYDCHQDGFYSRDTSDMVAILVEKLNSGQMDALRRAREELAQLGDEALLAVARVMNHHFSERMASPHMQNAVDVLAMAPPGSGATLDIVHDALVRALDYSEAAVRLRAVQALAQGHARPVDYDRLRRQLDVEPATAQVSIAAAMFQSDSERATSEALAWIEAGEYQQLWANIIETIGGLDLPEVGEAAKRLYVEGPPALRPKMAALAARAGDAQAVEALVEWANAEREQDRMIALQALGAARQLEPIVDHLRNDPSARVRVIAVQLLEQFPSAEEVVPVLREALEDGYSEVRGLALSSLIKRGSPEAVDRALVDLGSTNRDVARVALEALRPSLQDPELAQRALDRLLAQDALAAGESIDARSGTLQLIGQIPLAESARYLLAIGREDPEAVVGKLSLHRWATIQASNTGVAGRSVLAEAYESEIDPVRRIDLIWAVGAQRDALARETFFAALEREGLSEYERLYLFDRLCRAGPATEVAPRLKALVLSLQIPEVRSAAQCLLWRWY